MNITFIKHSSFLVEGEKIALLFDYYEGEVAFPLGKDLIVFASHRHGDHYNKRIFDLPAKVFVVSDDIPRKDVPAGVVVHWIGPHQKIDLEGLTVSTLRSTDEGVAFIIEVEEKTLYFAGDLNNWFWEEEGESYTTEMEKAYHKEIDLLPKQIHVAFVPVDPRLGEYYSKGALDLLERTQISYMIPMHLWNRFEIAHTLKEFLNSRDVEVLAAGDDGDQWRIT